MIATQSTTHPPLVGTPDPRPLIAIYCDGSADNDRPDSGGGWGAVIKYANTDDYEFLNQIERSGHIPGPCRSGQAELEAVIRAVDSLGAGPHRIEIHTDSNYAIRAIRGEIKKVMHNAELVDKITKLTRLHWLSAVHVPGHTGDGRQGRAHELAEMARVGGGIDEQESAHKYNYAAGEV